MFKKSERLTQSEFSEYFKKGKRHHSKHYTVVTCPHSTRKMAVVVGKKVAKSAVKRNAIRRRVYAALRRTFTTEPFVGVMIVIGKPSLATLSRKTLQSELEAVVAQALKSA